jgi:hypothetical protein
MVRVGYDADTAKYYFRDGEGVCFLLTYFTRTSIRQSVLAGVLYAGDEGAEYGELVRGGYFLIVNERLLQRYPRQYQMPFRTVTGTWKRHQQGRTGINPSQWTKSVPAISVLKLFSQPFLFYSQIITRATKTPTARSHPSS